MSPFDAACATMGGGLGRARLHRPGAVGRVHPHRLHRGHHGAVRRRRRVGDGDLGLQVADPITGAVGAPSEGQGRRHDGAERHRRGGPPDHLAVPTRGGRVQPGLQPTGGRLRAGGALPHPRPAARAPRPCRADGARGAPVRPRAHGLHPRPGSRPPHRRRPVPRGGVAVAHRRRDRGGERPLPPDGGRGRHGDLRRARRRDLHQRAQRGRHPHRHRPVRGAGGHGSHRRGAHRGAFGRPRSLTDAKAFVIAPPPIQGIGNAGGWKLFVQDRRRGLPALEETVVEVVARADAMPGLAAPFTLLNTATPRLHAGIDRVRTKELGVPPDRSGRCRSVSAPPSPTTSAP